MKRILLLLVFVHPLLWCNNPTINSRITYYAYTYRIPTAQQPLLKALAYATDMNTFYKKYKDTIIEASDNLREALYWLALEQNKSELAQKILFIIENK